MGEVITKQQGAVGCITLNRPNALNALNHSMSLSIEHALDAWEHLDAVRAVLIDGAGEKAFCAGGDIVRVYRDGVQGIDLPAEQFWRDEYRLNSKIKVYKKPYVAFMDGIVMGGGAGVSVHGSHRIMTERTIFAMPECSIGLIPDVGGSYFLAKTPGFMGEYIGLTGARLNGADAIYLGLADYYVHSDTLPALKQHLARFGDPEVIHEYAQEAPSSELADQQALIDDAFAGANPAEIMDALSQRDQDAAADMLRMMEAASPISLIMSLQTIRAARSSGDLNEALKREFRYVSRCILDADFIEGIRAAVIDRDRCPKWKYSDLYSVPPELIAMLSGPAKNGDLKI